MPEEPTPPARRYFKVKNPGNYQALYVHLDGSHGLPKGRTLRAIPSKNDCPQNEAGECLISFSRKFMQEADTTYLEDKVLAGKIEELTSEEWHAEFTTEP